MWKHVYLSKPLVDLLGHPEMLKLTKIRQLGPSYLVYPGATHTRLNHSIGVFHLAKRMIHKIVLSPSCPALTLCGVKSFLAAALLHDLGHFPYTHSLKELSLKEHEQLAASTITRTDLAAHLRNEIGTDPDMVACIIDEDRSVEGMSRTRHDEIKLYRSILSGALDPDKLDYLNRDAYFCGVPYGLQDVDFVIDQIEPLPDYRLALRPEGIQAVETILFSKYLMYRAVYWHKTVRVATAMIKKGLYMSLRDGHIHAEDLYNLDDESFIRAMSDSGSPAGTLVQDVSMRRLHKVLLDMPYDEWNDRLRALTDLKQRTAFEAELASRVAVKLGVSVGEADIVIDIPEQVSFEVDMPISDSGAVSSYPDSASVFTEEVIREFTATLRRVRLMCRAAPGLDTATVKSTFRSMI